MDTAARRLALLILVLVTLAGAGFAAGASAAPPASGALAALAQRYYDTQARLDALYSATLAGDNRFDDRLPITIAPRERERRFAHYRRVQRELAAIDRGALSASDALTHDLLARELKTRLGFEAFADHLLPLQQMDAVPTLLANLGSGQAEQPLDTPAQYDAYLRRIARLPAWVDQAIANLREGQRRRIVQPRPIVQAVLAQLRPMAVQAGNPFLAPVQRISPRWPETQRQRLAAAYAAQVTQRIAPAMHKLVRFLEREYLPAARDSVGWSALPDGARWYRQWVRDQTTTELTPEEIHAVGQREVTRIEGELARVAPRLGYEGDARQLLAWVRTHPRFKPYQSEAQILEAYREINRKVNARLPQLFGRFPKAPLDVRPEPELTKAAASDHYALPAEDGSRPGVFWAVINDPSEYDVSTMTALFLHEGQPGHHFQMAMQQEMALPEFRKRGAHSSLLRRRLEDAARAGCPIARASRPSTRS